MSLRNDEIDELHSNQKHLISSVAFLEKSVWELSCLLHSLSMEVLRLCEKIEEIEDKNEY